MLTEHQKLRISQLGDETLDKAILVADIFGPMTCQIIQNQPPIVKSYLTIKAIYHGNIALKPKTKPPVIFETEKKQKQLLQHDLLI